MPRPRTDDRKHNIRVGYEVRLIIHDLLIESKEDGVFVDGSHVDEVVGRQVNAVARAVYDLALRELSPSLN